MLNDHDVCSEHDIIERMDDAVQDILGFISRQMVNGYMPPHAIAGYAVTGFQDHPDYAALIAVAGRLTGEVLESYREVQKSWPAITDCDRLDRALAELERAGIPARNSYGYHVTGADNEDSTKKWGHSPGDRPARGATFIRDEQLDLAIVSGTLPLEYYSAESTREAKAAIGKEIVKVLRRNGFKPYWVKDAPSSFILVPMDWKRRWRSSGSV